MAECPACGRENPEDARFCSDCGAVLGAPAVESVRKTVTVVFCDVVGSTTLGEQLDPESVRRAMGRYFEDAQAVIERHGGTVEKFIGDAVMAVFGIPRLHEDDALRAVRTAAELRDAVGALGDELEGELGVRIEARIGVATGEVVAGDHSSGQAFVTGDVVNVAARLEQAAGPREVLLGERTHELVRDAVRVEHAGPLALKGKSSPVAAWRLLDLTDTPAVTRALDSPFMGRERELAALFAALERAVRRERFAWGREPRCCQTLRITLPGSRRAIVANLHATSQKSSPRFAELELERAMGLLEGFARPDEVIILAGDFNLEPARSETFEALARLGFSAPGATIDHVLVRGAEVSPLSSWASKHRRRHGVLLSDHAPVELTIIMAAPSPSIIRSSDLPERAVSLS